MGDIVERCQRCHELLTNPMDIGTEDFSALATANPLDVLAPAPSCYDMAAMLRGWSRGECRRRGVSISEEFSTSIPSMKWASLKLGRNDFHPVYIDYATT